MSGSEALQVAASDPPPDQSSADVQLVNSLFGKELALLTDVFRGQVV